MFLSRCTHHFLNDPEKFTTERSKVMFAGSYLQGIAYSWFESLLRQVEADPNDPPAELDSFSEFKQSLQTNFGDPNIERTMEREIRNLRQVTSVAAYTMEFKRISSLLWWNDRALKGQYYEGLKSNIKDELAHEPNDPASLNELVKAATRLDNRYLERLMEKKSSTTSYRTPLPQPRQNLSSFLPRSTYAPPAPATDGSTPMELDMTSNTRPRGPLSLQEKQRRTALGLCRYCGKPGHFAQGCAELQARLHATAATTTPAHKAHLAAAETEPQAKEPVPE
jgi:hypothetical protein